MSDHSRETLIQWAVTACPAGEDVVAYVNAALVEADEGQLSCAERREVLEARERALMVSETT